MKLKDLFAIDKHRLFQASLSVARSADRIIRWHHEYVKVEPEHEKPVRQMYLSELWMMIRRCVKLGFYLLTHRKKATEKKESIPPGNLRKSIS